MYVLRLVENIELKSMHFALIKKYKKGYYFLHFYKRELGKFSSQQFYLGGHAQTMWTIFWTFLTPPPPFVDSFTK